MKEENNSPKISVIVPAYNAADFIEECLNSLAKQSMDDFEVLVVDDGSKDSTAEKAKKFSDKDPRFKVIRLSHGGVAHARNAGIDNAQGEYITFVDADDTLHPQGLKIMLDAILTTKSQVCITELKKIKTPELLAQAMEEHINPIVTPDVYDYEEVMKMALYQKRLLNSLCGVLIKKELLTPDKRFSHGIRYEDLDAFYRFYEKAEKIVLLPVGVYFYRHNPDSFINTWTEARLDVLDVTDRMADFFENNYPGLQRAARDRRFSAHYNILLLMLKHEVDNQKAIQRCLDVIRKDRLKALIDTNVRLKNKIGALASFGGMPVLRLIRKL